MKPSMAAQINPHEEDKFCNSTFVAPPDTPDNLMRTFTTGATRQVDDDKLDYEGFLSPVVLERYAQYLHRHRIQADGKLRASDNWAKGIPKDVYMKSLLRHVMDAWQHPRGYITNENPEETLCAIMFNSMGYLFEALREGK